MQLSGGQRQRVALARVDRQPPELLLLDEPLGALDLKLRQEMQVFLKALQRELGMTFLYVTHDQEEALTMSDHVAVFNEGRIEQIGTPAEIYERPGDRVRRRLRRHLEHPRAERPQIHHSPGEGDPARRRRGRGRAGPRSGDVVYLGAVTRYVVALDGGGELVALRQNLETSSAEALEQRGKRVRLTWRPEHTFPIDQPETTPLQGG